MNSILLRALVAVCGLTWLALLVMQGTVEASRQLWVPFGTVVTVVSVLVWVFDEWVWSWWPFSLAVRRADLRGTWRGELVSEWVDPKTGTTHPPIAVVVCVTQTASTLFLRQFTAESESATVAASFLNEPDGAEAVTVVYRNEPRGNLRERSPIHFGGMRLRVSGDARLAGEYWTDRSTRGQVALTRTSKKRCRSFADAENLAIASSDS